MEPVEPGESCRGSSEFSGTTKTSVTSGTNGTRETSGNKETSRTSVREMSLPAGNGETC